MRRLWCGVLLAVAFATPAHAQDPGYSTSPGLELGRQTQDWMSFWPKGERPTLQTVRIPVVVLGQSYGQPVTFDRMATNIDVWQHELRWVQTAAALAVVIPVAIASVLGD